MNTKMRIIKEIQEATKESVNEATQDPLFLEVMDKLLERDKERHFLNLAQLRVKIPHDYNTSTLKKDEEE